VTNVTALIITKDEESQIGACLESVGWADEIIVVDSGSRDGTVSVSKQHGARVLEHAWTGYAAQKNWGIEQAGGDWVLSLDADERVSPDLRQELRNLLAAPPDRAGYFVPRKNYLGRHWMRYAGQYPDYQLRLFRRDKGRFEGVVHERVHVAGSVGYLNSALLHLTHRDLSAYVSKINHYSTLEAEAWFAAGRRCRGRELARAIAAFPWLYLVKSGWRDGVTGFVVSACQTLYVWLRCFKVWELECAQSGCGGGHDEQDAI